MDVIYCSHFQPSLKLQKTVKFWKHSRDDRILKIHKAECSVKQLITKNPASIVGFQHSDGAFRRLTDGSATCRRVDESHWEASSQLRHRAADECHGNQLRVFTVSERHVITWHGVVRPENGRDWLNDKPHSHLWQPITADYYHQQWWVSLNLT